MRVAVVDDNARDRAWLAGELEALLARRGLEGRVLAFGRGLPESRPGGAVRPGLPGRVHGEPGRHGDGPGPAGI